VDRVWGRLGGAPDHGHHVIGGMLAASVLGIFFVPACFYLVEKIAGASREKLPAVVPHSPEPAQGD